MKRLMCIAVLITNVVAFSQNNVMWKNSSKTKSSKEINKTNMPLKHLFDLDFKSMKDVLASSPKRNANNVSNTIIELPNGNGKNEKFRVYENSVMAPELAAKYPQIKSYVAVGIDNPHARAYFSSSPLGFKSMTLYPDESAVFIEPVTDDLNTYTIYKKSDNVALDTFECGVVDHVTNEVQPESKYKTFAYGADDAKLRTFRLALSCTGEYAANFGGTKAGALAGMTNTLTRVSGIFERDFGVRLVLIANNDAVIYTSSTTDPYSDYTSKANWRSEIQTTFNNVVGAANYDIGHLFSFAGAPSGDAGCIGCLCDDTKKGSGYTCASPNRNCGDIFDVDYAAHEMGHQLGADHTYTHLNDGTIAQVEPGEGTTIMSYAGRSLKGIQPNSDAYFHAISIQQITNNIKTKTCAAVLSTGNSVPVINAGLDYTIPKGTPFMLTGSASDGNSDDMLTYCWEEMDNGNATYTVPTATATLGPLFRSCTPVTSPTRYFPTMSSILAGSTTTAGKYILSEALPSVARTLKFRLTVRDNRAGGSANNTDDMVVTVDGAAGPFTVDSQNTAVSYAAGTSQTINWTVAGTNANGVNCANVDILLSTDGGKTFPITLLASTPNDGSQSVVIPNMPGTTNRIMVKGTDQIFFDVNNANLTITGSGSADTSAPSASTLSASGTTTSSTNLSWNAATDNIGVTGYNVYQNGSLKTTTTATSLAVSGLTASTSYSFYVTAKDASGNISAASNTVNVTTSAAADTTAPTVCTVSASGTTTSGTNLSWNAASDNVGVTGYNVYQNGSLKTTTTATSLAVSGLTASTSYSFYVTAKDASGNSSAASNTVNVTTSAAADTTAPTASTLSASGTTTSGTNLSWNAASDNVGVIGYNVYQNGSLKTITTATSLVVSGLTASTAYSFYVVAKDAAGNVSAASNTAYVTTSAAADTTAPTASTLSASGTTTSGTNLSWTAASDNVGVIGYNVYQNGSLKTITTATSLAVSGLSASTAYSFYVTAKDAAGNVSAVSNTAYVTTSAAADTTAPTASTLSASGTTTSGTNLSWTAASDNVGVIGYNVYQNGSLISTTASASMTVSGLSASTTYSFYVVAKDAAGNLSNASNTVNVTTLEEVANTGVVLYPVPANTELNVESSTINKYNLDVYNSSGRRVNVYSTSYTGKVVIDTTTLENGVYILKLSNGKDKSTYRFSVQH